MDPFPTKYRKDLVFNNSTTNQLKQNNKRPLASEADNIVKRRKIGNLVDEPCTTSNTSLKGGAGNDRLNQLHLVEGTSTTSKSSLRGCAANDRLSRLRQNLELSKKNSFETVKTKSSNTATKVHNVIHTISSKNNSSHNIPNKTNVKTSMQDRLLNARINTRKPTMSQTSTHIKCTEKANKTVYEKSYRPLLDNNNCATISNAQTNTSNMKPSIFQRSTSIKYTEKRENGTALNKFNIPSIANKSYEIITTSPNINGLNPAIFQSSTPNKFSTIPVKSNSPLLANNNYNSITTTHISTSNIKSETLQLGTPIKYTEHKSYGTVFPKSNLSFLANNNCETITTAQIINTNLNPATFQYNSSISKNKLNSVILDKTTSPLLSTNKCDQIASNLDKYANSVMYNPEQKSEQEKKKRYDKFQSEANNESVDSNDSSEDMAMDWTTIDPEEVISDIRSVREEMNIQPAANKSVFTERIMQECKSGSNSRNNHNIYVVVDTNVFINCLQTISNILHLTYEDDTNPVILVPWMVIQELDYFKEGYSVSEKYAKSKVLQKQAIAAIRFINDCLLSKRPNFEGQSVRDAANNNLIGSNPDDSILSCCFQVAARQRVILLTSDTNLRNKALINSIESCMPTDILNVLKRNNTAKKKNTIMPDVCDCLSLLFSFLISTELKKCYGEYLYKRKNFKSLPWSFIDCIKYMKDYYRDIFQPHLQKQSIKVVNDLNNILISKDCVPNNKFLDLVWSLLIYIKSGLPQYSRNIESAIAEIKQLERKN